MNWNGSPLIQNITWNALNQPTGWSWAFTTPVNATRSYDTAGRTTATEIMSYSYDAAGRITSLTQNLGQPADSDPNSTSVTFANTTFTVGYDATGRITSFGDGATTTSFTYDANGNRQSSTTTAGATTTSRTYAVEATSNRLTGFTQDITGPGGNSSTAVSYTYNANGDITADGLRNFSFDAEGRLSSVATGVWVQRPDGSWVNAGNAADMIGGSEASGRKGKDREPPWKRDRGRKQRGE